MIWVVTKPEFSKPCVMLPNPANWQRNGFSFSQLRPKNTLVKIALAGRWDPWFLHVYDKAFGEIAQGGPPGCQYGGSQGRPSGYEDFINCKTDEVPSPTLISRWGLPMLYEAVENDDMWDLRFPDVAS
jgi:hypothetical protein